VLWRTQQTVHPTLHTQYPNVVHHPNAVHYLSCQLLSMMTIQYKDDSWYSLAGSNEIYKFLRNSEFKWEAQWSIKRRDFSILACIFLPSYVLLSSKCHNCYVKKTNNMHLYLNKLFQLNYTLHVLNKQVHHQEVISVHATYTISHSSTGCLAANMARHPVDGTYNILLY
jgi:hypothetical protein